MEKKEIVNGEGNYTEQKKLLDYQEAAAYLGISPYTLRNLVCRRAVPFVKIGSRTYFTGEILDQWIEKKIQAPIGA